MSWTDEKVEELKRLWFEGITTGEIGRRLNMSKNSVVGKVHRLGLSGRPSPIKKRDDEDPDFFDDIPMEEAPKPSKTNKVKASSDEKKETKVSSPKEKKVSQPKVSSHPTKEKILTVEDEEENDIKLVQAIEEEHKEAPAKDFVRLTDLDNHTCRWPIGDPKDENFHFCGKKVRSGQTYCEEHAVIAYVKPTKK